MTASPLERARLEHGPRVHYRAVDHRSRAPARSAPIASGPEPRLAYLVSRYPAISHTFILREVRELRRLGFEVSVASVNAPDQAPANRSAEENHEAAHTYYLKAHGLRGALAAHLWACSRFPLRYFKGLAYALGLAGVDLRRLAYGFFYFTEALMVGQWMQRRGCSHLHVHFATAAANIAMIVRRMFSITQSMTIHGPDEFYDAGRYRLAEKIAMADFVICIGRFARSQAMKVSSRNHWHKFDVVPLGVDPQRYDARRETPPETAFQMLCVGRLVPAKGQHILIEACRMLRDRGHRFVLRIVGDGPDRDALEAAVRDHGMDKHVIFAGALGEDRVLELYRQADAFVLPSFAEGIPVVLMEAMAMGVPCVSTRITGIPELICAEAEGLLVTPSDAHELCSAVERLILQPMLRMNLSLRARAKVLAAYDLRRNVKRLSEVFLSRLAVPPGGR